MLQLVEAKDELPPSLFISGVHRINENAIGCGGFADIWQGKIDGKAGLVALKVPRTYDHSRGALKVCHI